MSKQEELKDGEGIDVDNMTQEELMAISKKDLRKMTPDQLQKASEFCFPDSTDLENGIAPDNIFFSEMARRAIKEADQPRETLKKINEAETIDELCEILAKRKDKIKDGGKESDPKKEALKIEELKKSFRLSPSSKITVQSVEAMGITGGEELSEIVVRLFEQEFSTEDQGKREAIIKRNIKELEG